MGYSSPMADFNDYPRFPPNSSSNFNFTPGSWGSVGRSHASKKWHRNIFWLVVFHHPEMKNMRQSKWVNISPKFRGELSNQFEWNHHLETHSKWMYGIFITYIKVIFCCQLAVNMPVSSSLTYGRIAFWKDTSCRESPHNQDLAQSIVMSKHLV